MIESDSGEVVIILTDDERKANGFRPDSDMVYYRYEHKPANGGWIEGKDDGMYNGWDECYLKPIGPTDMNMVFTVEDIRVKCSCGARALYGDYLCEACRGFAAACGNCDGIAPPDDYLCRKCRE